MKAFFKEKKELIINQADKNEELILEEFIRKFNSQKFDIVFNKLLDINGEVSGMAIELIKKNDTEPSTPTETVED